MKKVALGMSGGIDSTMSALLLMEQGYEVIGLTMSIWDPSIPIAESTKSGCFGPGEVDDLAAAKLASEKLGIEHHVIRLQEGFRENVLDYFCSTYLDGKTPNPCVFCNQRMKFGLLQAQARAAGIEYDLFATGHYVRNRYDEASGRWQILKALDETKDQSYFLTFLSQEQIKGAIFPLGSMRKADLKAFAAERGWQYLIKKKESQDFLETDDYGVLFEEDTFQPGNIYDLDGKLVGKHNGLIHYTIGQRRNLGLSGMPEPYYVISIDARDNSLTVGPGQHLLGDRLIAGDVNWVSVEPIASPRRVSAKIRLAHEAAAATLIPRADGRIELVFDEPQLSITPGQVAVFYDQDVLLGGGIIE